MSEDRKVADPYPHTYGGLRGSLIKIGVLLLFAGFWLLLLLLYAALSWWLLIILAAPLYLVGEWLAEKVFATKYGWSTEQVGFSPMRILLGVLLILGIAAVVYFGLKLVN